jgi:predicted anti-sigma-YlaC factor YlaD
VMHPKPHLCERAQSWASLRADDELSELESALLDAHLARCRPCRAFAAGAEALAAVLRSAPVSRPEPLVVRAARPERTALRAVQVAAALTLVVSAGVVAAVSGSPGSASAARPVAMVAGADSPDRLRELRRPALVAQARAVPRNRQLPGEPV